MCPPLAGRGVNGGGTLSVQIGTEFYDDLLASLGPLVDHLISVTAYLARATP